MKKSELLGYREKLHAIRARLRGDVTAMAEVALRKSGIEGSDSNAMPIHMAELGSDNFEQEFTLGLLEADEDTLDMIEAAGNKVPHPAVLFCLLMLLLAFILIGFLMSIPVPNILPKWAILAPVFVPLFLKLGIAPDVVLAAYRVSE